MTEEEIIEKSFNKLFSIASEVNTSDWKEGEIQPLIGAYGINKEKTAIYKLQFNQWIPIMNISINQ